MPTIDKGVHGRVNQILHCVVGSRVPIRLCCLFSVQLRECCPQALSELIAHKRVGFDGGIVVQSSTGAAGFCNDEFLGAGRVDREDQARVLEVNCLASEFGDALDLESVWARRWQLGRCNGKPT